MAVVDVVSYVAEFTGIAIGLDVVGIPPVISMPLAYLANLAIVLRRKMTTIERILIAVTAALIVSYAGSLLARGFIRSEVFYFSASPQYFFLLAASVGAVVMPFMLFYQASATAKKGTVRLWGMRAETLIGAIASEMGMVVITMATAGLAPSFQLTNAKQLANGLSSIAGSYAPYLFAVGLVAAAFTALVVISLASSWAMVDTFGWKKKGFYVVSTLETLPAAVVPILYANPLNLVLVLMVVFVFILIGPGVLLGLLAQDRKVMGDLVSRGAWRVGYWVSLAFVVSFGFMALFAAL
jgi:Mn2+/Fe2+ NRAMP family transporter